MILQPRLFQCTSSDHVTFAHLLMTMQWLADAEANLKN